MSSKIYTLPSCPWCVKAKKLLDVSGIQYEEVQGFHESWKTVPYIQIDGEPIGGFTELAQFLRRN